MLDIHEEGIELFWLAVRHCVVILRFYVDIIGICRCTQALRYLLLPLDQIVIFLLKFDRISQLLFVLSLIEI